MSRHDDETAPFAYEGLDRVIHEKARLGLLTSLISHPDGLSFNDLKQLCGLTDGNLNRHLQVLQDAGVVATAKVPDGQRSLTRAWLTPGGRQRFLEYLEVLEKVVRDAAMSTSSGAIRPQHQSRSA